MFTRTMMTISLKIEVLIALLRIVGNTQSQRHSKIKTSDEGKKLLTIISTSLSTLQGQVRLLELSSLIISKKLILAKTN